MTQGTPARSVRAAHALLCVAALGAALVLVVRVGSWARCWRFAVTEGRESPGVYAIWRVLHGYPLYESPTQPPYSVTLYNFGFYRAYAAVLGWLGVDGEGLLAVPRLLTALGALVGALIFFQLAAALARPRDTLGWVALGALSFTVWFGTQFTSWWAISVRPDLWAAALALLGLRLGLCLGPERSRRALPLLLSSASFFAAWTFKQSTVWTLAGLVIALGIAREARAALIVALPCGALMAASLAWGGELYRFNLLTAPAVSGFSGALLRDVLSRAIPQNVWVFGGFWLLILAPGWGLRVAWQRLEPSRRELAIVVLVSVTFGVLALGREGSNKNHLLEGYVASALASWVALVALSRNETVRAWVPGVTVALLVPLALMPWFQLVSPNAGRIVLCTEDDARELASLSEAVARLPKPLYSSDEEVHALPWHSSDNRYPALVLDGTWFSIAHRVGLLGQRFPFDVLASGRFKSALFRAKHPHLKALKRDGVPCAPLAAAPFGLHYEACVLGLP